MLPLLGLLKIKARDLIGYGLLYLVVNTVLVLFFMWFFARTFAFVPPAVF
jgi:short-chain fatty acids transporter